MSPAGRESLYGFPDKRGRMLSNSGLGIFAANKDIGTMNSESLALLNYSLKSLPHNMHHGNLHHLNNGDPRPLNQHSRNFNRSAAARHSKAVHHIPIKLHNAQSFITGNS